MAGKSKGTFDGHQSGKTPRKRVYGFDYSHGAEAQHIAFYEVHLVNVRAYFATQNASHLLCEACWEDGDGWQQVCKFLDSPTPSGPFPHANPRIIASADADCLAENKRRIAVQVKQLSEC
ncbi:MAG: sulfotransferase [Paracoccaceae bacterium]